ncbi:phage holin family protein [Gleimia sp. 6138-11-ORH1]|uniref:phage holin family protein n=1 Tax=Gleimia sp. 6138-11-ORH1 TaxID=2973937 RepID=UPI00216A500A|nr:phage holin family protein [Gleimia sp. 6138-11-ORH1]MCS4484697.1 phage holin family protein [Gleimia sp. 6138-11-ORH1]
MSTESSQPVEPVTIVNTTQSRGATSLGQLFAEMSAQVSTLVRGEIELTKVKAVSMVKKLGIGAVLLAGAGLFALYLLGWIFHTIELLLALVVPVWAASLITTGIILLIVIILALLGMSLLKKGQADKPNPKENINLNITAIKKGLGK